MNLSDAVELLAAKQAELFKSGKPNQKEWAELEGNWTALLNQFPDDGSLLFMLGTMYSQTGRTGPALALLAKAAQMADFGAGPWLNMGVSYKIGHDDAKAEQCYLNALGEARRKPALDDRGVNLDEAHALHGLASLHVNAGRPNKVLEWANKCLQVDPKDRFALWNKGLAHLELGEWEEGFRLYDEAGFIADGLKPMERKLKTYGGLPRWDGEKGKTVITYGEQGVGDEIMFLSMLPDLMKDCRVIVDCDPRIEKMIRRSFPDLEAVYATSEIDAAFPWIENHKVDAYVPMGSLGKYYRKTPDDFPKASYLKPDPEKVAKWAHMLKGFDGLKVGISWMGGLKKTRADKRSIPLEFWGDILKTPDVNFFSLQYHGTAADEAAQVGTKHGVPIHHWADMIASYEETAGFLANMDLVITVNTSLHHLAGALGVRQWCLTPVYCAWRYGIKGPSPWYGNCEMLRQPKDGDWESVLTKVRNKLEHMTAAQKVAA